MRIGIVLTVFVALFLAAGPVMADTDLGQKGKVGLFDINDSSGTPVVCNYDSVFMVSIDVPAVSIWSRDTTSGRDKRKVGWQILLEQSDDGGTSWSIVDRLPIHTNWAWDDQAALFPTRHFTRANYPFGDDHSALFRVIEKMYWYARDGQTVIGRAKHRNDNYSMIGFGSGAYCINVVS